MSSSVTSSVNIHLSTSIQEPAEVIKDLVKVTGPLDVYCWYDGPRGLPEAGASFLKQNIFAPLYKQKKDAKAHPYSLNAWDFSHSVSKMTITTDLGDEMNRINTKAVECLYSSSFFHYCTFISQKSKLYDFVAKELPQKKWLMDLSATQPEKGMKVADFFDRQSTVFDSIGDLDVVRAYSLFQYFEGYYLIHESVQKALSLGQSKVEIAFVLPNDESKYYVDYPKDIEKMLRLDFDKEIDQINIGISMQFFKYTDSIKARPYLCKKGSNVDTKNILSYFDYLGTASSKTSEGDSLFRDVIHNLNGWY